MITATQMIRALNSCGPVRLALIDGAGNVLIATNELTTPLNPGDQLTLRLSDVTDDESPVPAHVERPGHRQLREELAEQIAKVPTWDARFDGSIARHPLDVLHDVQALILGSCPIAGCSCKAPPVECGHVWHMNDVVSWSCQWFPGHDGNHGTDLWPGHPLRWTTEGQLVKEEGRQPTITHPPKLQGGPNDVHDARLRCPRCTSSQDTP